jgi:hypothetical protein
VQSSPFSTITNAILRLLFAAGADIKEMKDKTFAESYKADFLGSWQKITQFTKPVVGAVNGYAVSLPPHHRLTPTDRHLSSAADVNLR